MEIKKVVVCILFVLLAGCSSDEIELLMSPPYDESNDDGFWETIEATETTLSVEALEEHIRLCKNTGADSQIVVYKGKIVSEWYSENYSEPIGAMSSTKVIASIIIGQLVDSDLISYNTRVKDILPEWTGGYRDSVTIKHILTHTGGFNRRYEKDTSVGYAKNKSGFVLQLYPDRVPGTQFEYSNEGVQLLEPIINRIAGEKTEDYVKRALFSPLGMNNSNLYTYGGSAWLYAEMRTTPRDLARIGLLMKNKGTWNGERLVSEQYIQNATQPSKDESRTGYLWWILDNKKTVKGFYASGYLNTDIYIFHNYDIVIVRTQAPKNGFSGKNESGNYFTKAMPLFKKIVNQ